MPGFELFGDIERKEVHEVLETGVLMRYGFDGMRQGRWKARELEQEIQNQLQVKHAQVVSSGTAAVSMALAVAGIGAGDEVIMPTFTFVASFEAVMMVGAIPKLVDVDNTLTLDPLAVEKAISPKTKAIMPVHMCGSMADLSAFKALCAKYHLKLIEDACQAIGATYQGKALGTIGDVGCFSFDFVKTVTCGEGGAVVTNNSEFYQNADHFSDHGHDHLGMDRGAEGHPFLGYNFRISELNAAVGLAQMKRLPSFIETQKKHYTIIREAISQVKGIEFRAVPEGGEESYAFLNFFMPTLDAARKTMEGFKDQGVDGCFHYYDNNWHYIRKWEHLKELKTLYPIPQDVGEGLKYLHDANFDQSDHFIGRNISCLIKLSWTEEEVKNRAEKMVMVISELLT